MSDIAIKVEDLAKLYQLGTVSTGTLRHDVQRWVASLKGKEDPYAKVGQLNDRTHKAESEFVWALKDINFEVKKGEVLGIIGNNGAGKSTLLKILSKITAPSKGKIMMDGRLASLLEVGTGFHPELTGRENIFMNGAILGMRKSEIGKKLDQIIDFSGVEAYIDTPVKRYSSGMYVRLAFAVAAFLEPEILIVDEVLAVGDAEFQKKCLGRMNEVSKISGKTVLFVSHNMTSIQRLCTNGLFLENGRLIAMRDINSIIDIYLNKHRKGINNCVQYEFKKNLQACITEIRLENMSGEISNSFLISQSWKIKVFVKINQNVNNLICGIGIVSSNDIPINTSWHSSVNLQKGHYCFEFIEEKLFYATGLYTINVGLSLGNNSIQYFEGAISMNIIPAFYENNERVVKYESSVGFITNQMKTNLNQI